MKKLFVKNQKNQQVYNEKNIEEKVLVSTIAHLSRR
jgi:hypothetical protein